ncbi:Stf0 family sulfotransferase (plasmid) [Tritonibacter scottomollicae]|uniref:Stf0 family sulfotransferase n=1 Tax=Tritonibacter scottomollicae TaxID=483013 RepID=A0ABZ0HKD8_TRISK|nr:Stf0 family sulfotransferase [Tritonibacter scottomollicae]WOI35318.1 Stf0 family sulfotransferase [Tritonibacter scottomollicae]
MTVISLLSATGVHEKALRRFFKGDVFHNGSKIFDHPLYCIGFHNRSGSNLLADYLRNTPYFSGFHEQLNFNTVENQSSEWGVKNFPDFIREATIRFGGGQFVHGFKASVDQLMMLQRFNIPKMFKGGMRIIHITRRDLVGQAISFQIASQTQRWTSQQVGLGDDVKVAFDESKITNVIDAAQKSANGISMFSEVFGCPRLHVSYEELVQSPSQTLARVARFAGQEAAEWPIGDPKISRQSSELNTHFREMYIDRLREMLECPH